MENPFELILERLERIENAIEKLKVNTPIGNVEDEGFINIDEASKILHMTKPSIYGRVHSKQIPAYKRGRLLFKKSELIKWIESTRCNTNEDLQKKVNDFLSNSKFRI